MTNNLTIAGSHADRLATWKQGLNGLVSTTLEVDSLSTLGNYVAQIMPNVLLLDLDLLGSNRATSFRSIFANTKTIVLGGAISDDMEWELLKAGVRGYCRSDSDPQSIRQVVVAVQQGELWIRRTLTCRLIDELGKRTEDAYRASHGLLSKLTQREYDIAVRVGNGEKNKQIAKECAITERTVKAHLTEVFQKLGVTDRLNLALVLSAGEQANRLGNSGEQIGRRF